jgi:hypothetical protein
MTNLTQEKRDELIDRLVHLSVRLGQIFDGPAREDLKAELRQLARLLWLDGSPEP